MPRSSSTLKGQSRLSSSHIDRASASREKSMNAAEAEDAVACYSTSSTLKGESDGASPTLPGQRKRRVPAHDAGSAKSTAAAGEEADAAGGSGSKKRRSSERGAAAAAAAAASTTKGTAGASGTTPGGAAALTLSSPSFTSGFGPKLDEKEDGAGAGSKGLRHFSMKVCRKVEEKGQTTYNEVADELVTEFLGLSAAAPSEGGATSAPAGGSNGSQKGAGKANGGQFDEKNIRRRVYDALNVLMAMDIIAKDKKDIMWKGLPTSAQHNRDSLERERSRLERCVATKQAHLALLMEQRVVYNNLVKRNADREQAAAAQALDSAAAAQQGAGDHSSFSSAPQEGLAAGETSPAAAADGDMASTKEGAPSAAAAAAALRAAELYQQSDSHVYGRSGSFDGGVTPTIAGASSVGVSSLSGLSPKLLVENSAPASSSSSSHHQHHGVVGGSHGLMSRSAWAPRRSPTASPSTASSRGSGGGGRGLLGGLSALSAAGAAVESDEEDMKIPLPFMVVTTSKDTAVTCEMDEPRHDVRFEFSDAFELTDDAEVLQRLNLHRASKEELHSIFPSRFHAYLPEDLVQTDEGK